MSIELTTFKKVLPANSIISDNSNNVTALDHQSPFTFYDFLKYSKEVITPQNYNESYQIYLQLWYKKQGLIDGDVQSNIKARYIELLQDISLKYTTVEEKRFLSNIDLNNPTEAAIIIPFYSRKIFEICQFYTQKREKITYQVEKNKIKGNQSSVKIAVFEELTDYVFQNDEPVNFEIVNTPLSAIIQNLDIETVELFDLYNDYFDLDPTISATDYDVKNFERKEYFTSNVNDINADLFINFDKALKQEIFSGVVFLSELGKNFSINYDFTSVNLDCKLSDSFYQYITSSIDSSTRIVNLRKKLIEKYIGTDFYYLSTGSTITNVGSGKLFTATNPTGNLLNRHFPSTATIEEKSELKDIRTIGGFFTPDKQGILYFSYPEKKYKIDYSKLEPDKIYIFPDPNMYGNTTGLTRNIYDLPLIQIIDYNTSVNNSSMYYAEGDVRITPYTQSFYGYYSLGQIHNSKQIGLSGTTTNFSSLYNKGIITDWKSDIYGNQYGIFKHSPPKLYKSVNSDIRPKCIVIDGHLLYDDDEYYNFDYSATGTIGTNTIRTGLTAQSFLSSTYSPSFTAENTLYFREIYPYEECPDPSKTCLFVDGGSLTFNNGELLPETYSTDSTTWPGSIYDTTYFYNELYDAGIGSISPSFNHAISGNPALSGNLTLAYQTSSDSYLLLDCYTFLGNTCKLTNDYNYRYNSGVYVDDVIETSLTEFSTITSEAVNYTQANYQSLTGKAFVRNISNSIVYPLSAALSAILIKYSAAVQNDVNTEIKHLYIHDNTIFIESSNYLIIDKLLFDEIFQAPNTANNVIALSGLSFAAPFIHETLGYSIIVTMSGYNTQSNLVTYYPIIYKYTFATNSVKKIYPLNTTALSEITSHYSSSLNVKLTHISVPNLTYNSRNKKYGLTWVGYDQNHMSYIYQSIFDYKNDAIDINCANVYKLSDWTKTLTHNMRDSQSLTMYNLVSTSPINSNFKISSSDGTIIIV
jgi:hypothetical protein